MEKVVKDGMVAVLYSPGFGAGWFSWNEEYPQCIFDPDLVAAVLSGESVKVCELAEEKYGEFFYTGGARDLRVCWVKQGEQFEITEYDGSEDVNIIGENQYMVA